MTFSLIEPMTNISIKITHSLESKPNNCTELTIMWQLDKDKQEINHEMIPTTDFDRESYQTPRGSVRDYTSFLDLPSLQQRINRCNRDEYEIKRGKGDMVLP